MEEPLSEVTLPYVPAYGNITKVLERIQKASTPSRFTQDFLATKLDMKGGSPKPVIPFLKRTGFLGSDGSPTGLYKRFRNPAQSSRAGAEALRRGYAALYEVNEYVHEVSDSELKGLMVQVTGLAEDAAAIQKALGSFKALRAFADFDSEVVEDEIDETVDLEVASGSDVPLPSGLSLGYTINLHLPPTPDIAVFDAIFKSLRNHLMR